MLLTVYKWIAEKKKKQQRIIIFKYSLNILKNYEKDSWDVIKFERS